MSKKVVRDVGGFSVEVPGVDGEVGPTRRQFDPLGRLQSLHHPVYRSVLSSTPRDAKSVGLEYQIVKNGIEL